MSQISWNLDMDFFPTLSATQLLSIPRKAKARTTATVPQFLGILGNDNQCETGSCAGRIYETSMVLKMCTIRGAVFFLASVHIFFSVVQFACTLPAVVGKGGEKGFEAAVSFIFCGLFFATGFMTFRGADEESVQLIRLGGLCLVFVTTFRFGLIGLSMKLLQKLPEASFLYVYDIPMLPVLFTLLLYSVYLVLQYFYYKKLKHEEAAAGERSPSTAEQRISMVSI